MMSVSLMLLSPVKSLLHTSVRQFSCFKQGSLHLHKNSQPPAMVLTVDCVSLPDAEELEQILTVAIEAAKKAGDLIRENIGARVKYSKTNYKVCRRQIFVLAPNRMKDIIFIFYSIIAFDL